MRKVHSWFTKKGRPYDEPAGAKREKLTVPDQSLKIKDILDRFTRGLPLTDKPTAKPVFIDDMTLDSPDLNEEKNLDKPEQAERARSFKANYKKEKLKEKEVVEVVPQPVPKIE